MYIDRVEHSCVVGRVSSCLVCKTGWQNTESEYPKDDYTLMLLFLVSAMPGTPILEVGSNGFDRYLYSKGIFN